MKKTDEKKEKKIRCNFTLDEDVSELMKKTAKERGLSTSALVSFVMTAYCKNRIKVSDRI